MYALAAERTQVAKLDDQILALERSLSALWAQRTLIQKRLDSYKYPVLTLPNEIVSEIFVHFLPVYPDRPPLTGVLSPTNLTQICRKWRDIALTTPALWRAASLSIDDMGGISTPFAQQLHELDEWLSRSRCCPFSVEIEELSPSVERDFILSSARCARWEHLAVFLMNRPFLAIDGPLPILRDFVLEIENLGFEDLIVFLEAPLLRSATLNDMALGAVDLPWAQLTSLTLQRVFPAECNPVLQKTPNLVHCKLNLVTNIDDTRPWSVVTLPRLESLTLVPFNVFPNMVPGYLETLIVPALRELQIAERILDSPIDSLTSFISKSGCKLQGMYICWMRKVSKDAYCRAFPSVRLSFDESFVGEGADVAPSSDVEKDSDSEQE
ncbi:hypothetical protein C8F04DRAFT_1085259 [Mycena alexandri]|uniref:F-box domain-containing protein n=1 Tax=Mycena alexandri TaxID=1745969 RepID=A0AAD6T7L9_9AGAR|nr:hypothetical protein C8F04DRAFT_1085259 [Mycena alexandri]